MEESTLLFSVSAFVVSIVTLALSLINASINEHDERMQLIISQLLSQDLSVGGKLQKDVEEMLSNKAVVGCNCSCNGRGELVDKYNELRRAKKRRFWLFVTSFFFVLLGFFLWLDYARFFSI
uniref:hypothetical protein n=1 Tax=uncultured Halomonas sp. TaxID=173971 RepID=UPI0026137402|nr:hypothetical protein [uncultured Halomonas sp.]